MITIPDRLLEEDFVTVFFRSSSTVMLKKQISQPLLERSSYVSKHVLTVVVEGEQHIRAYDGETITLRAGQMGAIRRGLYTVTDLIANNGHFTAFLLFFDDEQLGRFFPLTADASATSLLPFHQFPLPTYVPAFWRSVEQLYATMPHHPSLLSLKVDELVAVLTAGEAGRVLSGHLSQWATTSPRNLRRFMEENYDKALTVEDYAYLTGRSESTFRRDFKARFGVPPRRWIIRRRLERAYQLLEGTDWDVSRVAEAVGYDNVSHFISAFKKKYQRTPRQKRMLEQPFDRKAAS